jgi:hypothetical protein
MRKFSLLFSYSDKFFYSFQYFFGFRKRLFAFHMNIFFFVYFFFVPLYLLYITKVVPYTVGNGKRRYPPGGSAFAPPVSPVGSDSQAEHRGGHLPDR